MRRDACLCCAGEVVQERRAERHTHTSIIAHSSPLATPHFRSPCKDRTLHVWTKEGEGNRAHEQRERERSMEMQHAHIPRFLQYTHMLKHRHTHTHTNTHSLHRSPPQLRGLLHLPGPCSSRPCSARVCTCVHVCVCVCVCAHVHACVCVCAHACV